MGRTWSRAEAKAFAAAADVVVVAAGFTSATEGEGNDRTFALPWGQDALIEAVAEANPHTVVTLTGGGGMDTQRWLDQGSRAAPCSTIPARKAVRPLRRFSSESTAPRASSRQLRSQLGTKILQPRTITRSRAPTPRCT